MDRDSQSRMPAELKEELSSLPEGQRREMIRTWELLGGATELLGGSTELPVDVPGIDDAWNQVAARTVNTNGAHWPAAGGAESGGEPAASRRGRTARASDRSGRAGHRRTTRRRIAAGLLSLAVAALGLFVWQLPVSVTAPPGDSSTFTLADGSQVDLNSATRLRYRPRTLPFSAPERRLVELDGEAFFTVTPDERPFVVETATARVEVLGTRFNIRERSEAGERTAEITLASGRVRVTPIHEPNRAAILSRAGETAYVRGESGADTSLVIRDASLDHVLAWRHDAFAAIDRPVASVLAELERRFALSITTEEGVAVHDSITLLHGPGTSAERVLHDVCLVQGCRFRPTSRGFALFMPTQNPNR